MPETEVASDDDGTVVQMDIAYSYEALCSEASLTFPCDKTQSASIVSRIQFLTAQTTETMRNSGVNLRFELIKTWLAEDYDESRGLTGDDILTGMQTDNDGLFETPSLAANRDLDCADLVGLVIKDAIGGSGPFGIAFIGSPTSTSQNGFFVSSLGSQAISGFTFTHEIGHTLVSFIVLPLRFVLPHRANQMCAVISSNLSLLNMIQMG